MHIGLYNIIADRTSQSDTQQSGIIYAFTHDNDAIMFLTALGVLNKSHRISYLLREVCCRKWGPSSRRRNEPPEVQLRHST